MSLHFFRIENTLVSRIRLGKLGNGPLAIVKVVTVKTLPRKLAEFDAFVRLID